MKKEKDSKNFNIDEQSELYKLLVKLFSSWSNWEIYQSLYLKKLLPSLKISLDKANDNEKEIISKIKNISTKEEWENLEIIAKYVYKNEKLIERKNKCFSLFYETLNNNLFIDCFDYIKFNKLFDEKDKIELFIELNKKIDEYVIRVKQNIDKNSEKFLDKEVFDSFIENLSELPQKRQQEIKFYLSEQIKHAKTLTCLENILSEYNFEEADSYFFNKPVSLLHEKYEKLKAKYIKKWFEEKQKIQINNEQSLAIAKNTQNTLITARAGSGKTRTIACRAIFAMEKENLKPTEIMLLAFNKKAAEEIQQRIANDFNYTRFNKYTARTFHSLAWAIVNPKEEPIWDDRDNDVKQKLTSFIQCLYKTKNIWNEEFKNKLYEVYRDDESNINQKFILQNLSDEQRYIFLRNKKRVTLNGGKVDSNGEKWIADFLFEHDIKYAYSKLLTYSKAKLYRPDFTLYVNNKNYIIEHWGIDENDMLKQTAKNFRKSWDEYHEEMQWKRKTCKIKGIPLIETSIKDMEDGRVVFENKLKEKLERLGIICKKLPQKEILNRLEVQFKDNISKRFANFIQYAQKIELTPDELRQKLNSIDFSPKSKLYLELAINLYSEYKTELKKQNKTDFDNVILDAIDKIEKTKGNCKILLGKNILKIKELKILLIDEFQDFSKLYYNLVEAIRKYNLNLKIFCVGDDWQAINSFAGSDLRYFKKYNELYLNSGNANLLYNYRSQKNIVNFGNCIMYGQGKPAIAYNNSDIFNLELLYIDDVNSKNEKNEIDEQFIYDEKEKKYFNLQHRYLKLCFEIVKQNLDKSFIIMHRKNKLSNNSDLSLFKNALVQKIIQYMIVTKQKFTKEEIKARIQCDTIHQFKGSEAHIVIILECNDDNFPLIHQNYEDGLIFDKTIKEMLEEELRIFYVAITRAKQQVYFVSEKNKESDYLLSHFSQIYKN